MDTRRGFRGGAMSSSLNIVMVSLVSIRLLLVGIVLGQSNDTQYSPPTDLWINCGGMINASIATVGLFSPDTTSYISEGILAENTSAANNDNNPYPDLLNSARIFGGQSSYKLPVVPGNVWVRLWFYPVTYKNYEPKNGLFSVIANEYTLLTDLTQAPTDGLLFKEYMINAKTNILSLTFRPAAPDKFAYVNGLAVVSAPSGFLANQVDLVPRAPIKFVMQNNAVENMYRLNVGGGSVNPPEDSYLTRQWETDKPYLFGAAQGVAVIPVPSSAIIYPETVPRWTAPASVYSTARVLGSSGVVNTLANITWIFNIDAGYAYYIRLHFAEIVYTAIGQRVFNVFLNNRTAYSFFDVLECAQGSADTACFLDYVVPMYELTYGKLWVQMGPAKGMGQFADCIMNGIEIYKINNTDSSLSTFFS